MHQLVWPREHGAWGMLLVPLATGAALGLFSGGSAWPLLALTVAALALFCLRTPVESLWGTSPIKACSPEERRTVSRYLLAFAAVAALSLALLLWGGRNLGLLVIGAIAGAMFVAQALVKQASKRARMMSQMLGAIGLTSTAPAAYYVATGHLDSHAFALWLANWVFAGNQIHFVQLRVHASKLTTVREKLARGRAFFSGQFAMFVVLIAAWLTGLLPVLAIVAFLPVFVRGLVWFFSGPQPLSLKRLGFTELAHAIAFGVLLIAAFRLG